MIETEIFQLQRGAAELDGPAVAADHLIGKRRMRILEHRQALLRPPVRDDGGAGVLERLAAGDVVEMMMAVDQVLDGLVGDLLDLGDIVLPAGRPSVGDRVGRDDAVPCNDEHRLMIAVAEDVNVVGAADLGGLRSAAAFAVAPAQLLQIRRRSKRSPSLKDEPATPPFAARAASSLSPPPP